MGILVGIGSYTLSFGSRKKAADEYDKKVYLKMIKQYCLSSNSEKKWGLSKFKQ